VNGQGRDRHARGAAVKGQLGRAQCAAALRKHEQGAIDQVIEAAGEGRAVVVLERCVLVADDLDAVDQQAAECMAAQLHGDHEAYRPGECCRIGPAIGRAVAMQAGDQQRPVRPNMIRALQANPAEEEKADQARNDSVPPADEAAPPPDARSPFLLAPSREGERVG
jgi:hypothetical protein